MGLQISLRLISFRRHISDARFWISCLNNVYIHRLEITFTPQVHRITEKTTLLFNLFTGNIYKDFGSERVSMRMSTFNQNELSPLCLLCREDDETIEHFLLHCPVLDSVRRVLLNDLVNIYENLYHEQPDASRLLQFILDCGLVKYDDT